ncbi:MAG TPA: hypothetical protein VFS15_26255 [Kofleriaceae bacterium]|nr:hypothetical protein [Kofleriaceae bacterium]
MLLVILAAGGMSYAADAGDPMLEIAKALQAIDGTTTKIANQTNTIAQQTTTVAQQNLQIANQTAALAKANVQLDQKLDAVLNAIGQIQVPPPAPAAGPGSPAHKVWLAPFVDQLTINGHTTLAAVRVLNAGVVPATFTCDFFSRDGVRLVHHQNRISLEPGTSSVCAPISTTYDPPVVQGWSIVVSDNPVIVTGSNSRLDGGTFSIAENMVVRPIDCSGDQAGIEFACDAVAEIQKEK